MGQNIERKMAWIAKIDAIEVIPNADAIEVAIVGGWKCVVKKGEFKAGELAIYASIDSWIPTEIAPFLSKGKEPREFNGVKGERLKTIRLRGQVSQGLLLPIFSDPSGTYVQYVDPVTGVDDYMTVSEGDDVTEFLHIQKWEAPISPQLAGISRGSFPSFGRKTDQERCLSGDTLVETNDGHKTIKEICNAKLSVLVKSYNHDLDTIEFKPVIGWSVMTRRKGWVKVKTKSGKELIMTKNHRVWVDDLQCYRLASELQVGNLLKI